MRISVLGLGYVGAVTAVCLAAEGHHVVGVDTNQVKVDMLANGESPVIEEGVAELAREAVDAGLLSATVDLQRAVAETEIGFVCVGTPSRHNGSLDLSYLERVCQHLGSALRTKEGFFVVVVRSTVLPGTVRGVVIPTLESASGRQVGVDFGVCVNPEFLREGSAVDDFRHPPKVVVGSSDERSRSALARLVERAGTPSLHVELETAELVKYADNAWHGLKVAFANEIGTLAKAQGLDGRHVMRVFCSDQKLNLSAAYLRPGFAFGGSCLPKDLRALCHRSHDLDLDLPVLNSILPSNRQQLDRAFELVTSSDHRRIGVLGLSFKAGTDDLRESPLVDLVERLIGKGYDVRVYDHNVELARLVGANRDFILHQIPHISGLMVGSVEELLAHAQTVVVGTDDPAFDEAIAAVTEDHRLVDLVRNDSGIREGTNAYEGICW
jgi:GDP-mannose 6-dehydrogenase